MFKFFGLNKILKFWEMVQMNGGPIGSLSKIFRFDTLKDGRYVGQDALGNFYYENKRYMIGRSRWVEYNPSFGWDYEGSQVSPEWFGWLHYKTDRFPCEDEAKMYLYHCTSACKWLMAPTENPTATICQYYPYSTTRPNVQPWDGKTVCQRLGC